MNELPFETDYKFKPFMLGSDSEEEPDKDQSMNDLIVDLFSLERVKRKLKKKIKI